MRERGTCLPALRSASLLSRRDGLCRISNRRSSLPGSQFAIVKASLCVSVFGASFTRIQSAAVGGKFIDVSNGSRRTLACFSPTRNVEQVLVRCRCTRTRSILMEQCHVMLTSQVPDSIDMSVRRKNYSDSSLNHSEL